MSEVCAQFLGFVFTCHINFILQGSDYNLNQTAVNHNIFKLSSLLIDFVFGMCSDISEPKHVRYLSLAYSSAFVHVRKSHILCTPNKYESVSEKRFHPNKPWVVKNKLAQ